MHVPVEKMWAVHSGVCSDPSLIETKGLLTQIPQGPVLGPRRTLQFKDGGPLQNNKGFRNKLWGWLYLVIHNQIKNTLLLPTRI